MSGKANLDKLFNPRKIAVIGASSKPGKLGYNVLKNLLSHGFKGEIIPVNPREKEIFNVKCYPSILEAPEGIDLVILAIPAGQTVKAVEDCGRKGVRFAIVEAAGFAELGAEGDTLQGELVKVARKYGLRIVGPNCAGIVNLANGVVTTFAPLEKLRRGKVSILAQAGIFAVDMLQIYRLGFSKVVSLGNMADLGLADFLEYLAEDPETSVIGIYVEGVKDGRRFLEALRTASKVKPVIVLKGGRTVEGAGKVRTHTASLAGSPEVWNSALQQFGAIQAEGVSEFFNLLRFFSRQPPMGGLNLSIITYTGSMGILAVDKSVSLGLKIAEYGEECLAEIRRIAPPWTRAWNPLDLSFFFTKEQYVKFIETVMGMPEVHGVLCIIPALRLWEVGGAVADAAKKFKGKPLVFCVPMAEALGEEIYRFEEKFGVPCYFTPEDSVTVLAKSYWWFVRQNIFNRL